MRISHPPERRWFVRDSFARIGLRRPIGLRCFFGSIRKRRRLISAEPFFPEAPAATLDASGLVGGLLRIRIRSIRQTTMTNPAQGKKTVHAGIRPEVGAPVA